MFWAIYIIVVVTFVLTYLFIMTNLLRMKKIQIFNYYASDFESFDLKKLQMKFKLSYKKYNESKYEVFKILSDDIENLEKSIYKIIQSEYNDLINHLKKWYLGLFGYGSFRKTIRNLDEKQEEYKIKFLSILFELNEMSLDYEIKDNLLILIKDLYGEIKSTINNSNYFNEIAVSPLNDEILVIENDIEFLEKIVISNYALDIFEKSSKKLIAKIEELFYESIFFIRAMNFLKIYLPRYNKDLIKLQNPKNKIYQFYWKIWKKDLESIKKDINFINESIKEKVKIKTYEKIQGKITTVVDKIVIILSEAKDAVSYWNIVNELSSKLDTLMKGMRVEFEKAINDLNKYFLKEKELKIKNLNKTFNSIELEYKEFLIKKNDNFKNYNPKQIYSDFSKVVKLIKNFFSDLNTIILDIKLIIDQTNNVNDILYEMNNSLLQIEIKMNLLPEKIKFVKEQEFQRYQNKVSEFIEKYKDNFLMLSNDENSMIKYENKNVRDFYKNVISETYLYNYIELLIVTLNKYRNDKKIDELIDLVENNYVHGNLSESLRIANKIVELYKIYE